MHSCLMRRSRVALRTFFFCAGAFLLLTGMKPGLAFGQNPVWREIYDGLGPRSGATVFDDSRGVAVHVTPSRDFVCETWEWNGASWALRTTSGPSYRSFFAMAFDSRRGVTVLFGGISESNFDRFQETWEWDGR